MLSSKAVRHKHVHRFSQQLRPVVAKQRSGPRVHLLNESFSAANQDCVRREFEQHARVLLAFAQSCLDAFAFRRVARDFGKAEQCSLQVADCCYDDVSPETRSIFPDSPSLVFGAARFGGESQFLLGLAGCNFLGTIKTGKVMSDDFRRRIPFDAFRRAAPGPDFTLSIQLKNRVVPHALDEEPKQFVRVMSGLFIYPFFVFRQVSPRPRNQTSLVLPNSHDIASATGAPRACDATEYREP